MADQVFSYEETGGAKFSLGAFPWRKVTVRAYAGLPRDSGARKDTSSQFAGSFHYRSSALSSSPCRNRFIVWKYSESQLKLLELSLDINLVSNALLLEMEGAHTHLIPNVTVQESQDHSMVVILFSTSSAVYRLVLPHPAHIMKDPSLSAVGKGQVPSVLAFATEQSFIGPNMATIFAEMSSASPVSMCTGCIAVDGTTTFALASPSGAIFTVEVPPPGEHGLPVRSQLQESSVMYRLFSSFIPLKGSAEAEDAPASLRLHIFEEQTIILSLCRDLKLRLWSCQLGQCVLTHSLYEYIQTDIDPSIKADKLVLKTAPGRSVNTLKVGVHIRIGGHSQISLFQVSLIESHLHLQPLQNFCCPQNSSLVDFFLTNHELWGVWTQRGSDGEEGTLVKRAAYKSELKSCWRPVSLWPSPPKEINVAPQKDPREVYLDELFYPGRFSTQALCKALELYGIDLRESEVNEQRLTTLVSLQVEQELQATAGSLELHHDEYRELNLKCWAKFYGCCYQYHQLLLLPLALSQDPGTGMGLLLKSGTISFLWPDSLTRCTFNGQILEASLPSKDVTVFLECVRETVTKLNVDVLDSFLLELTENRSRGQSPQSMAMEVAAALHEGGCDIAIDSKLSSISDLSEVLQCLLEGLDPIQHSAMDDSHQVDSECQTAMSQLFGSRLSGVLLASTFQGVCHSRLCLCRDVLVMLCAMESSGSSQVPTARRFISQFSSLLLSYHTLHWLATRIPLPAISSPLDTNVRQLAALEISPTRVAKSSLIELYLSSGGHQELILQLTRQQVFSLSPTTLHSYWTNLLPITIHLLIAQLWPMTSSCHVCEFLLAESQYTHVKEFLSLVQVYVSSPHFSHLYLLGKAYLGVGDLSKAFNCFSQAAAGIGKPTEPFLESVVSDGVEEGRCEGNSGTVSYFIKVMRLFEQVSSPLYIIKVAELAFSLTDRKDPAAVVLWSNLFKYHLDLGHSREAYEAMMANPDPTERRDCLRRLVVVLTEQKRMRELCQFTYSGMEDEIEKVIEDRARSVDVVRHNYYHLLYCFYTCRGNYRKAAHVMYECGLRVGREVPGVKSLQRQANCYCMVLTTLGLTDPKYAWVVKPVELETQSAVSRGRKRAHSTHKVSSKKQVEVLTMKDIDKVYFLVRAKLKLVQRDPQLATQLSSPFVSPDEVSTLMVQAGLFDFAIELANKFSISLESIFEALAARCVHLSVNKMTFRQSSGDTSAWDWVDHNETVTSVTRAREISIADKVWCLLRSLLEFHDPPSGHVLQGCVAKKILSLGEELPQWLVDTFKMTNPAELLRIYRTFNLLEPAVCLAMEYINAVMGHGREEFGLKTALHAPLPSVWLPYSELEHLRKDLKRVPHDSPLRNLSDRFADKLKHYFEMVESVSMEMEQFAQEKQSQPNSTSSLLYMY